MLMRRCTAMAASVRRWWAGSSMGDWVRSAREGGGREARGAVGGVRGRGPPGRGAGGGGWGGGIGGGGGGEVGREFGRSPAFRSRRRPQQWGQTARAGGFSARP